MSKVNVLYERQRAAPCRFCGPLLTSPAASRAVPRLGLLGELDLGTCVVAYSALFLYGASPVP